MSWYTNKPPHTGCTVTYAASIRDTEGTTILCTIFIVEEKLEIYSVVLSGTTPELSDILLQV